MAIAAGCALGLVIQERPGASLAVPAGLAGILAVVICVVQQRCGWREEASIHSQISSRYHSIVRRIDRLDNSYRDNDWDQRANSVIDEFGAMRMSAPNTEELEFLGRLISSPGIR